MTGNIHFISAGAGSGKTYSLTRKLEERLTTGRVDPAGVVATTFTRLAAGELRERVRGRLLASGHTAIANRMEQARIGTVNSVCGEFLQRFSFEAGIAPEQRVLDERQGRLLFFQAMELALEGHSGLVREMNALSHRIQLTEPGGALLWRAEVKQIVDAARANNQSPTQVRAAGPESAASLLAQFPPPSRDNPDGDMLGAVNSALADIDPVFDSTRTTATYLTRLQGVQAALVNRRMTWPEWISLTKSTPGKKSAAAAAPVREAAREFEHHPALHRDIRRLAEQLFNIAADTMETFQQVKSGKGLLDFVDQEQLLYRLLDNPAVAAVLEEELQLLMVDEFQDTSPIQLALFLKLSRLADEVIWVGDIKQSIYGFRGSDPELMQAVVDEVTERGNPPEVLTRSWRSRPALVDYINHVFAPAFAPAIPRSRVVLEPARVQDSGEPAVENWLLRGNTKAARAEALATGISAFIDSGRTIPDRANNAPRPVRYGDIAVLCRTHTNLAQVAGALARAGVPISYARPGLLATPEARLTMACLRRLIDPSDTLASAEIVALSECIEPDQWLPDRLAYVAENSGNGSRWLENDPSSVVAALAGARSRLPQLTPVETLRLAISTAGVRKSVYRWGPTPQRARQRLENLAALTRHAGEYLSQCAATGEPATAAGLVLWLSALATAGEDIQAGSTGGDAVHLLTHHGAKGLEWPVVIAMDLDSPLKPRLWGLNVLPAPDRVTLADPLAGRRLRYWPDFSGNHSTGVPLLDRIADSAEGQAALAREHEESKRLLYVSLTRPRDCLIIALNQRNPGGPWMQTLNADWMLPAGDELPLPDGRVIPARRAEYESSGTAPAETWHPQWLVDTPAAGKCLPLCISPSSLPPLASARAGETIRLGSRLALNGDYPVDRMGNALHAVIAARIRGSNNTARILADHGLTECIAAQAALDCSDRLLETLESRFKPLRYFVEYPVVYSGALGQVVSGWIDLLLETPEGFVLIDHKASPRPADEWHSIAESYSGQLQAYASGVEQATGRPVLGSWVHFAVTGALVEVVVDNKNTE